MNFLRVTMISAILILSTRAEAVNCSQRLISPVCGSGVVEIEFDLEEKTFNYKNGDVFCWNEYFGYKGTLNKIASKYPYFGERFELKGEYSISALGGTPKPMVGTVGELIFDSERKLARIQMTKAETPTANSVYYLTCSE